MAERFCPVCDNNKMLGHFITDFRKTDKYLPCCKSCTDKIVRDITAKYNLSSAIWCACMMNHVPFIRAVWDMSLNDIVELHAKSPFAIYYRNLKEFYGKYKGVWESNMWMGDFLQTESSEEAVVEEVPQETIDTPEINCPYTNEELEQLIKEWGKFINKNGEIEYEAYDYLINKYNEYTNNINGLTSAMSTQYRNLCKAEWLKIKADESGDINEVSKAQKLLDNLYSQLKLDDFAVEKSDTDRFIDRLIWKIEETEPAEIEDENKYKDIAGHETMYNNIMRSMRNIVANSRDFPDIPAGES